ncbi:MAG: translation initiation factor IF-2 [Phycisphaeraceae bacterium]|nr:translation initiation factor IF-2 [Phycisphaeraceae bacterium]
MAKTLRIHNLAKELGVQSKVIVAKCKDEGVPDITNHMSVVKVGLAHTIRQWFALDEEDHSKDTAVETTHNIDIKKVRKKSTKKKAAKKKAAAKETDAKAEVVADESAEAETKTKKKTTKKKTKAAAKKKPTADEPAEAAEVVAEADAKPAAEEKAPEKEPEKPGQAQPAGQQNVPTRPDIVKPAGEQLTKPKEVKLRGPKVIRVEKPEPVAPPRSRGPRRDQPADGEVPGVTRSRGPARGGGVKRGGGEGGGGDSGGRGNKRRSLSNRRGGRNDPLLTGPTQMSKADLDELDAKVRGASGYVKRRRQTFNKAGHVGSAAQSAVVTGGKVEIEEPITIKALSSATGIRAAEVVKFLFQKGIMANVNSAIETELAEEICLERDIELVVKEHETAAQKVEQDFMDREKVDVQPRPAVVTILGHVDHGKTSLLDRIRKADVAAHEDGGITQHVGAYRITVKGSDDSDKSVVFLDTPGHAAFTSMRARGAQVTDIVVLIVAADDGVMPQTIESINHAKAAEVPVVVAVNKCDLPGFSDNKLQEIYGQLAEHGLNPTAWGGETEVIKTSAETGEGIEELIEILDLQAEVLELTADYGGPARGIVIEGEMQSGRGSVARVLVQDGTIRVGDFMVSGRAFGRVRDMTNDRGEQVQEAGPATPLEISGLDEIPDAGDKFYVTQTLKKAEGVARQFRDDERAQAQASRTKVTMDNFAATIQAGKTNFLNVVIKADVQGSVETLKKSLGEIGNDEVAVRVIDSGVGGITESNVLLADASDAVIIGFHVTVTPAVREIADERHVEVRQYRVIYETIEDVKKALEGMLTPDQNEEEIGRAEVKQVFKIGKLGNIAGCMVSDGVVQKGQKMRVVRDGTVVTEGRELETLRRVKDEAKEVRAGTECGIRIAGYEDLKPGDELVCYKVVEVKRTLD